jgi:hypothetical protein
MDQNKKRDPVLIIGILIPVVMVILVSLSIYLPRLFAKPEFSFIYTTGSSYDAKYSYTIESGKLVRTELENRYGTRDVENNIYMYDAKGKEVKQISFEDAQKLTLDSSSKSPDGFEVVRGNGGGGVFPFFFFDSSGNQYVLRGKGATINLNLPIDYYDLNFLGWIIN